MRADAFSVQNWVSPDKLAVIQLLLFGDSYQVFFHCLPPPTIRAKGCCMQNWRNLTAVTPVILVWLMSELGLDDK